MDFIIEAAVAILLSSILSVLAWKMRLLTGYGSLSAFLVGTIIGVFGSLSWLLVLLLFTFLGFGATLYGLGKKKERGLQEGQEGERGHKNVLAVSVPPCLVAILSFVYGAQGTMVANIAFIASISVAASDTIASEMGIMYPDVWLITTFEKVPPGTNGGVSVMGTIWAFLGALVASVLGWVVINPLDALNPLFIIPIVAGFLGCMADSFLGATLERNGYIDKYINNMVTMILGSALAVVIYQVI